MLQNVTISGSIYLWFSRVAAPKIFLSALAPQSRQIRISVKPRLQKVLLDTLKMTAFDIQKLQEYQRAALWRIFSTN
jgi:hypothetical protein